MQELYPMSLPMVPPSDPVTWEVPRFPGGRANGDRHRQADGDVPCSRLARHWASIIQCTLYGNDPAHLETVNAAYGAVFPDKPTCPEPDLCCGSARPIRCRSILGGRPL